jgi:uncharacterized membrane protein YecN with MAPEG domain
MEWAAVVAALALAEYVWFGLQVGQARGRCGVKAPATSGHPEFERYFRVHQNTQEQLVLFLPSLWLFAAYVSPGIGALLGLVFVVGRFVYAQGYVRDPEARGTGFMIGFAATALLLVGGVIGALASAL